MRSLRLSLAAGIVLGTVLALLTTGASAAPTPFTLTFNGAHFVDASFPDGIRHDGRFTASAPFCPAGRAYDVSHVVTPSGFLDVMRLHTCDDGSGSITAFMPVVRGEHGGAGTWQIVEGTGRYAQLRGKGTYIGTHLSGDPDDFLTVVYRAEWQGFVDFDADPPAVESLSASARKLPKRVRVYALRVAVTGRDASSPISYAVDVRAGRVPLEFKIVSMTSGQAAVTLRISPPRGARSVRIGVAATDVLGNGPTTISRTVRLPK